MINYKYANLFNMSSVDKDLILTNGTTTIDSDNIIAESLELTESINSSQQLTFGTCESSRFKVSVVADAPKLTSFTAKIVLESGEDEPFFLGNYIVESDVESSDGLTREIIAYDAMKGILNADVSGWYDSLTFPLTVKQFRDSFFSHFGITQKTITLVNDSMTIEKTLNVENAVLSGKSVLNAICEINGVFGHINHFGQFKYIVLEESGELFPSNTLYPNDELYPNGEFSNLGSKYDSLKTESYKCSQITGLYLSSGQNSIAVQVGTTTNQYKINSNFLVQNKNNEQLTEIANNLLSVIKNVVDYRPYDCKTTYGNPCYNIGDSIRIVSPKVIVNSYILARTLSGIQALVDTYIADGVETITENANSNNALIENINGKIELVSNSIGLKVDKNGEITSSLTLDDNGIAFDSNGKVQMNTPLFTVTDSETSMGFWAFDATKGFYYNDADNLDKSIGMCPYDVGYAFWAGSTIENRWRAPFRVGHNGEVRCSNIISTGGKIANFTINENKLSHSTTKAITTGSQTDSMEICSSETANSDSVILKSVTQLNANNGGKKIEKIIDVNSSMIGFDSKVNDANFGGGQLDHTQLLYDFYDLDTSVHYTARFSPYGSHINGNAIQTAGSDIRLKENIKPTEVTALDKLNQIEMVTFDWNGKNHPKEHQELGLIANQLEEVIPECVFDVKQSEGSEFESLKNVNVFNLTGYCIKAIQELSAEVETLKAEIKSLKGEE